MSSGYVALADFDRLERRVKVLERQIAEYRRKEQATHPIETVRVNASGQAEVHSQPSSTAGHRSDGATPVEHIEACS
jgi:hypothetical protein